MHGVWGQKLNITKLQEMQHTALEDAYQTMDPVLLIISSQGSSRAKPLE